MSEEEQFVNIDLNDDNICSVCKLETDTETLSFCHVCFELSIEVAGMSTEELDQLKGQLLLQIQKVFEELTSAVQDKDSLASELHVRHIAIEQLFKNCGKLPWLQIGRAGVKASNTPVE